MKASYLLINILTVFFPLVLSFDMKVHFYKNWKYVFPALVISGLVFLLWDYLFTIYDVWSFNPDYVLGIYLLNLPLEEILFFITVPFACIFIYECLNAYFKKDYLGGVSRFISIALILLSVILLILFYDRVYSLITFGLLAALIFIAEFLLRTQIMGRFYLAFLVSLLPFYIVNGYLTSTPIVFYNNAENMAFRVGTIPFEDHFYSMSMLLLNVLLFEYFKKRGTVRNAIN